MIGISTWNRLMSEGKIDTQKLRVIWTSSGYCHCNFTVLASFPEEVGNRWTDSLLAMRYDDPRWRPLMDLEGLKRWIRADPAILEGYRVLFEAVDEQGLETAWTN
jgi:ABC-type phosphate/phosphonate transport system substrate-binding protein